MDHKREREDSRVGVGRLWRFETKMEAQQWDVAPFAGNNYNSKQQHTYPSLVFSVRKSLEANWVCNKRNFWYNGWPAWVIDTNTYLLMYLGIYYLLANHTSICVILMHLYFFKYFSQDSYLTFFYLLWMCKHVFFQIYFHWKCFFTS